MADTADQQLEVAGRDSGRRNLFLFAELFALSGVAFALPLLDIVSKNAQLLIINNTTIVEGIAFVALVLLVPPLVSFGIVAGIGAVRPRLRLPVHAALCGVFVSLVAIAVATNVIDAQLVAVALGVMAAIGAGVLTMRSTLARTFLHYLAIAPLVFGGLFLVQSDAGDVLFNAGGAVAAANVRTPHRVVVVMFDEFPEQSLLDGNGHVDQEIYPNFAALADDSTWYRNHTAVAGFTAGAVPAFLSGTYPSDPTAQATVGNYPQNLFTVLGQAYSMNVHEPVTHLCPTRLCRDRGGDGFGALVDQSVGLWSETLRPQPATRAFNDANAWKTAAPIAETFTESLGGGNDLQLDFAHIELPHYPWRTLKTMQTHRYVPGDPPGEAYLGLWPDGGGLTSARQRHLLQVQATDTVIGRIRDKLMAEGAWDDALVVVTADHGVAFTAGEPARNPTAKNYPELMWTPLFIKYPGQAAGVVDDRPAQSVDVLPTIAEVVGTDIADPIDGRSLRGALRAEGLRPLYPWTWFDTEKDLKPPAGRTYVEVDGATGFKQVLATRAVPASGDPDLRIYRAGEFGGLVGEKVTNVPRGEPSDFHASVTDPQRFNDVDPNAANASWAWNIGSVDEGAAGATIAVALNGRIVAVAASQPPNDGASAFTFLVPPELVQRGRNELAVYSLSGSAQAPVLHEMALDGS